MVTNMAKPSDPTHEIRTTYTPTERAALAQYLGVSDPAPAELAGVDITEPVDEDEWDEEKDGIAPLPSGTGYEGLMTENVIARICLRSSTVSLPQWASVSPRGVTLGRRESRRRPARRRRRPRHLFTINWADSGPGFSWPEAYHVTALPGYGVCIVTASADSPDAYGYCDVAIGWFQGDVRDIEQSGECVRSWWSQQKGEGGLERWSCLFSTGDVDEEAAARWADEVWPSGADDDEDELV
jgi:hypothetical protein